MDHLEKLAGEWVEIREREGKDELVLMRADADVPATRGGRRQLNMNAEGKVLSLAQGATFSNDQRVARSSRQVGLDNLGKGRPGALYPDCPVTAHERDRLGFVCKPGGIVL